MNIPQLKLLSLHLRNFKGQRDLLVAANGCDLRVFGDNAVGKTTIADAFYWLLFYKDSEGRTKFDVKTIDEQTGEVIHHLEHEVRGVFELADGDRLDLQKTYREVWEKPRGQSERIFSGHEVAYKINTVPVQKSEFDRRVASVCEEKRFRLLSDPTCFNLQTTWQLRRAMLIEVCGDVAFEEVVASNKKLAKLPAIIGNHSLVDYRKILDGTRKETNKLIGDIPSRIDEISRSMAQSIPASEDNVAQLRAEQTKLQGERATAVAGGSIAERQRQLATLQAEGITISNRLRAASAAKSGDAHTSAVAQARTAQNELSKTQLKRDDLQRSLDRLRHEVVQCESSLVELRRQRDELQAEYVSPADDSTTCPTCGQDLPESSLIAAREAAEANFNERRAQSLAKIVTEGVAKRDQKTSAIEKIAMLESDLFAVDTLEAAQLQELTALQQAVSEAAPVEIDFSQHPDYLKNLNDQTLVEREIEDLRKGSTTIVADLDQKIAALAQRITACDQADAIRGKREESQKRMNQLSQQELDLGKELERIDAELFLCDEYVRSQVKLLTARINDRFKLAKFQLFRTLVNGGLEECCETTYNGVPFSSLNHGAQMNVGLDIVNTLAEHSQFAPCIFIDNAESVTKILPTLGQQIQLVVAESDKTLRFETVA